MAHPVYIYIYRDTGAQKLVTVYDKTIVATKLRKLGKIKGHI